MQTKPQATVTGSGNSKYISEIKVLAWFPVPSGTTSAVTVLLKGTSAGQNTQGRTWL